MSDGSHAHETSAHADRALRRLLMAIWGAALLVFAGYALFIGYLATALGFEPCGLDDYQCSATTVSRVMGVGVAIGTIGSVACALGASFSGFAYLVRPIGPWGARCRRLSLWGIGLALFTLAWCLAFVLAAEILDFEVISDTDSR